MRESRRDGGRARKSRNKRGRMKEERQGTKKSAGFFVTSFSVSNWADAKRLVAEYCSYQTLSDSTGNE